MTWNYPTEALAPVGRAPIDRHRHLLEQLRALDKAAPNLMGSTGREPSEESLRSGYFEVYGQPVTLVPPIDWDQDPLKSRSWCYHLHALSWLTPALRMYAETGERLPLTVALEIAVDWASQHLDGGQMSPFAWNDMAVSQRAPSLAYLLRASLYEGAVDDNLATLLLSACERHGAELADISKYSAGHNHGLAQDEGLYLLARQLPVLSNSAAWAKLAVQRLRGTLSATIQEDEGAHLEHSSAYQFAITRMISRLVGVVDEMPELTELRNRLRLTASWHVTPRDTLAQLGDSDETTVPDWARDAASKHNGMNALFGVGNAFVRCSKSYLAVSASHHSAAHKHADDTGFLLIEDGETLLGDAGRWGYYEEELDRRYARSAHAHNVLTIDENDFEWRGVEPYGSGLLAVGEGEGWYGLLLTNLLLRPKEVRHRRLLLYRPAETLIVFDEVRARETHKYTRRFHFGPRLDAELTDRTRVRVVGPRTDAVLRDLSENSRVELCRGRDEPTRLGWTYPGDRQRLPVWTATLSTNTTDATFCTILEFGRPAPVIVRAKLDGNRGHLEVENGTLEIRLATDERRIEIRRAPPTAMPW